MKLTIYTIVLVLLILMSIPAQAGEQITNGNFETGDLTGWTQYQVVFWYVPNGVSETTVYDGSYSAHFVPDGSATFKYCYIQQTIDFTDQQILEFYHRSLHSTSNMGGTVYIGSTPYNIPLEIGVWNKQEINVSGYSGSHNVRFYFWAKNSGWKQAFVDNIAFDPSTTLSGTVTSSASGTIEGVSVSLNNSGGSDTTNETGYYEITGIEPDSYLLTAISATHSDYTDIVSITTDTTKNFQMTRLLPEIDTYNAEEEPTSIQLNFIGNGVTDSVKVYRDGTLLGTRATIISGNWIDTGLTVGETYEYCLTPYDGSIPGTQICFDATTVTTFAGSPFIPIGDETPVPTPTPDDNGGDDGIFDSIEDIIDPIFDIIESIIDDIDNSLSNLTEPLEDLMEPITKPVQVIYEEIIHTTETSSFLFILFAYVGATLASLFLFYINETEIDISTILLSGTIGWIIPLLITFIGIINLIFTSGILTGLVFAVFGFVSYVVMNNLTIEENIPGRTK